MAFQGNDGCGGDGGGGTPFACADLNSCSIDALGDVDTSTTPPQPGDVLVRNGAGQWVPGPAPAGAATVVQAGDTATVDTTVTGSGTTADPFVVSSNAIVSPTAGNQLTAGPDGLFVPTWDCSELAACELDALGNVNAPAPNDGDSLVFQGGQWVPAPISGGGTGTTYLAGDGIEFTSTTPGGPVTINADLSEQAGNQLSIAPDGGLFVTTPTDTTVVQGQDTATVDVTVTEAPDDTFTVSADAKLSAQAGNALTINPDGLFVPAAAGGGVTGVTATDTPTLDLTATPNADGSVTISGAPILSADAGNQLAAGSDGALFVPPLVTDCGLTGAGTAADPKRVATSGEWGGPALPFACEDYNGVAIYCDSNGQLRTAPEKFHRMPYNGQTGGTQLTPPATGQEQEIYDEIISITNLSTCREMRGFMSVMVDSTEFVMSPGNWWELWWGFAVSSDGTAPPEPTLNGGKLCSYRYTPQAQGILSIAFSGHNRRVPWEFYGVPAALAPGQNAQMRVRIVLRSLFTDLTPTEGETVHWSTPNLVLMAEGWNW